MTNSTDPVRAREILAHVIATEEAKGYAGRFGKDQKHVPEWAALEAIAAAIASAPVGALSAIAGQLRLAGAALPAPQVQGTPESGVITGLSIALALVESALAQQPAAPTLAKHQPCGCVICTCEDEQQCQGCGAKHCGNRADHPPYVAQRPAAPHWGNVPELDDEKPAAPSVEAVGDWVLVPRTPTLAMANAAWRELESQGIDPEDVEAQQVWDAMLAAAPQQPAGVDEAAAAIRAFEKHFQASADDPYFEGELELWLTAWRKALAAQQTEKVDGAATDSAVAAIRFALSDPEGMTFLRLWNEGEFDTLRREWPDAPVEVYVGADPLAAQQQGGAHERD